MKPAKETLLLECKKHGYTEFGARTNQNPRCRKCQVESTTQRRRKVAETLKLEAGGQCSNCGYSRCLAALDFHHSSPNQKEFGISSRGLTTSIGKLREETKKCVLLCANCHREIHAIIVP